MLWHHILVTISSTEKKAWQKNWKWVVDPGQWAEKKAKAIQGKRSKDVLGLVAPYDASDEADAMAPESFLAYLLRYDEARCGLGLTVLTG